jgi:hypothetical protein
MISPGSKTTLRNNLATAAPKENNSARLQVIIEVATNQLTNRQLATPDQRTRSSVIYPSAHSLARPPTHSASSCGRISSRRPQTPALNTCPWTPLACTEEVWAAPGSTSRTEASWPSGWSPTVWDASSLAAASPFTPIHASGSPRPASPRGTVSSSRGASETAWPTTACRPRSAATAASRSGAPDRVHQGPVERCQSVAKNYANWE